MSKGKQTTKLPSGGGGTLTLYYCHTCQRPFVNADALRLHCRSSKAHREKTSVPPSSPLVPVSSAGKPNVSLAPSSSTRKGFMCGICDRQFVNKAALRIHKKDSRKHRDRADSEASRRNKSSSIAKAQASGLNREKEIITVAVTAPEAKSEAETEARGTAAGENDDNIEEQLADLYYLEDQPRPRLGLNTRRTSFVKGDPDICIGLASAFAAQQSAYNIAVASASAGCQRKDTNAGSYESSVPPPEVPVPWSSPIPLSERDAVLSALQAQCHPIECLAEEQYWTQIPSSVDIDMMRRCRDCGATKRRISTDAAESVCRFHPARKLFQRGIMRGRGTGVPKMARCVNCRQFGGSSKGCIVLSAHAFAAPDAKLGKMAPTPAYNSAARKAVVLDCEMVGVLGATTGASSSRERSEVVRVSAVDFLSGEVILDTYVSPQSHVISWRTKFSGVNASILAEKKREGKMVKGGWRAARDLLWRFIDAQTVVIGHALKNDLAVLGMVHTRVVDSAIITRIAVGEDCQRHWALKTLVRQFLDRDIQTGSDGHDSVEDTYAAREVVLWCLRNASRLQAWAADERGIIAKKSRKKPKRKVLVTEGIELTPTS